MAPGGRAARGGGGCSADTGGGPPSSASGEGARSRRRSAGSSTQVFTGPLRPPALPSGAGRAQPGAEPGRGGRGRAAAPARARGMRCLGRRGTLPVLSRPSGPVPGPLPAAPLGLRRPRGSGVAGRPVGELPSPVLGCNGADLCSLGGNKEGFGVVFPPVTTLAFGRLGPLLPISPGAGKGRWLWKGEMVKFTKKSCCCRKTGFLVTGRESPRE